MLLLSIIILDLILINLSSQIIKLQILPPFSFKLIKYCGYSHMSTTHTCIDSTGLEVFIVIVTKCNKYWLNFKLYLCRYLRNAAVLCIDTSTSEFAPFLSSSVSAQISLSYSIMLFATSIRRFPGTKCYTLWLG